MTSPELTYPPDPPTVEQVRTYAAAIVAARGYDYVYPESERGVGESHTTCRYVFSDGTPGCFAGAILAAHGVPLQLLVPLEGDGIFRVVATLWPGRATASRQLLSTIQRRSDGNGGDGSNAAAWGDIFAAVFDASPEGTTTS